jgi:hypothetical protein
MMRGAAVPVVLLALIPVLMGQTMPLAAGMEAAAGGHKTQGLAVLAVLAVYREAVGVVLAAGLLSEVPVVQVGLAKSGFGRIR